jgi:hypothetical protein
LRRSEDFDRFVDTFARRIASFDRQALTEAKRLLNDHSDKPLAEATNESHKIFFGAFAWPGVAVRGQKLRELGSGKPGDLEMNYGAHLTRLAGDGNTGR